MNISFGQNNLRVIFDTAAAESMTAIAKPFDQLRNGVSGELRCRPKAFWRFLQQQFVYVKAAGGVVRDSGSHWLLIRHYGNWDLPKGMIEAGESRAASALREVQEETGLSALALDSLLYKSYHIHNRYGSWQLKQTTWFLMRSNAVQPPLRPQVEEDIDVAAWVDYATWHSRMAGSYSTMQQIAEIIDYPR